MKLIIVCGMVGTGKDTVLNQLDLSNYTVIGFDLGLEYICKKYNITYSEAFNNFGTEAQKYVYQEVELINNNKLNVIVNQTNLTLPSRFRWLSEFPNHKHKIIHVFNSNEGLWRKRLHDRYVNTGKLIPDDVIDSMLSRYEPPISDEGDILHVNTAINLDIEKIQQFI